MPSAQFMPPNQVHTFPPCVSPQFVAVQKAMCFFYEPTIAASRTAGSRASVAAPAPMERPSTPPPRFQPFQLQSLFQSVCGRPRPVALDAP